MRARQKNDNDEAFLMTYQQAAERYNLGVSTIMKTARECGAIRHLGKSARVVTSVMDRLEFPDLTEQQAIALFNRLVSFCEYHKVRDSKDTLIIFGYSNHKKWTPYCEVSTHKGATLKRYSMRIPVIIQSHIYILMLWEGRHTHLQSESIEINLRF